MWARESISARGQVLAAYVARRWTVRCGLFPGLLLVVLLSSCRSVAVDDPAPMDFVGPVDHSIVFLIHGDADYVYHDPSGKANEADKVALAKALRVAERNPAAEVFVFHERPRKRLLFLFPKDNGTFYYYRGGELLVEETYHRGKGASRLDPEVAYYHKYRSMQPSPPARIMVYLGHEIPEMDGVQYDASFRDGQFDMEDFSRGMAGLTANEGPFDLMVLSTCYNGTPYSIRAMAPLAETIIASPDNLHLSYLDLEPLERLDQKLGPGSRTDSVTQFARQFAQEAFERLARELQTVVTVAVYDTGEVKNYVDQVASAYDSTLTSLQDVPPARLEHVDCAEIERFALPGMSAGVDVFYRPPRFGRRTGRTSHSGWQCLQEM